jgi:hypothetical protein
MAQVFEHRVVARNPSTDSENRIHTYEVAWKYGFKALGGEWLEKGSATMRFSAP